MRLLVTGGAGFIGSNFIRWWARAHPDDEVINYDLLTYAGDRSSLADVEAGHTAYRFIRGDIADAAAVARAVQGADAIVNFAAESHNSRAVVDPAAFVRTNVLGTQTLLEAARDAGVARFHHVSTCEVYGEMDHGRREGFDEASPYRPRTPYSASKAAADHIVRAYGETFGLRVTISVCSNNYGPYQHPEKFIPLLVTSALDDLPLSLYASSSNAREWLHVDDHCAAIAAIVERGVPGETYNVGSGDERSIDQIADLVLHALAKPDSLKRYVPDRPGHDRRYLLDHSKIERELQWRPELPLERGLATTIDWYRSNEAWWRPKRLQRVDEAGWARRTTTR